MQLSLHLLRGLDESAASRLPAEIWQLFEKHCLPQTTLVFILCLLSGASSETEHLRKSDPNAKEFLLSDSSARLSKAIEAKQKLFAANGLSSDAESRLLAGNDLSLDPLRIK